MNSTQFYPHINKTKIISTDYWLSWQGLNVLSLSGLFFRPLLLILYLMSIVSGFAVCMSCEGPITYGFIPFYYLQFVKCWIHLSRNDTNTETSQGCISLRCISSTLGLFSGEPVRRAPWSAPCVIPVEVFMLTATEECLLIEGGTACK